MDEQEEEDDERPVCPNCLYNLDYIGQEAEDFRYYDEWSCRNCEYELKDYHGISI